MTTIVQPSLLTQRIKRFYLPHDPFFDLGNVELAVAHKQLAITDAELEELTQSKCDPFICAVTGCRARFNSIAEFNIHYQSVHSNVCSVCKRVLPTKRLLELHVLETHDSLFRVLAAKQKMVILFMHLS